MMTLAQAHALLAGCPRSRAGRRRRRAIAPRAQRHPHAAARRPVRGAAGRALRRPRLPAAGARRRRRGRARRARAWLEAGLPGLQVADTRAALGALAAALARAASTLPLIAVTGSNGKTTVTQMIAIILRAWQGDAALATAGQLQQRHRRAADAAAPAPGRASWHRVAVVELGMNHPGEIAQLGGVAAPTVALVNNAQREHQEFMANVEAVARENGAVIAALPARRRGRVPGRRRACAAVARARRRAAAADASRSTADGRAPTCTSPGRVERRPLGRPVLQHAGRRHRDARCAAPACTTSKNALAAAACALAAGCPLSAVVAGLEAFEPVKGRSQVAAASRSAAARSRWSTTATTPTRIRCAPPSTCWPPCPARAGWCWATWARSATRARRSTPKSAPTRAARRSRRSGPSARRRAARRARPSARARATSPPCRR